MEQRLEEFPPGFFSRQCGTGAANMGARRIRGSRQKNFAAHKNNNLLNRNPIKIGVNRHIPVALRLILGVSNR